MAEYSHSNPEETLDVMFYALSHHTRRDMLRRLSQGETRVTDLAAHYDISLAAASKHIIVLERAGLAARTIEGRDHRIAMRPDTLRTADEWLAYYRRFWLESFDRLADRLKQENSDA